MNLANTCPRCGVQLTAGTPPEKCPRCLLSLAVELGARERAEPTPPGAPARPPAPTIEELAPSFPQLEIQELVGQGGMGAVYRARQKGLDRTVALKVLLIDGTEGPEFAERFAREARALGKLNHPNIVAVHDSGLTDGRYWLLMEFVDGTDLRAKIRSGEVAQTETLGLISQLCAGLNYAHSQGVVHRDIKPENILVDGQGQVKIADFGLAKLLRRAPEMTTLTGPQQAMGTFHYMAPEQLERPLEVDHRADIYSMGVVFYELLMGELPLGRFGLPSEKLGIDVSVDEIVLRTLEKEPKRRYQHASEVQVRVDAIRSGDPASAGPVGVSEAGEERRHGRWKRHPVALFLTLGCGGFLFLSLMGAMALAFLGVSPAETTSQSAVPEHTEAGDTLRGLQDEIALSGELGPAEIVELATRIVDFDDGPTGTAVLMKLVEGMQLYANRTLPDTAAREALFAELGLQADRLGPSPGRDMMNIILGR